MAASIMLGRVAWPSMNARTSWVSPKATRRSCVRVTLAIAGGRSLRTRVLPSLSRLLGITWPTDTLAV